MLLPVFRHFNYGEELLGSGVVTTSVMMLIELTLGYFIIQAIFTQLGFNFLGAEIERNSNNQLLDDLQEGVIILDQHSRDVLFSNQAAKTCLSMKPLASEGPDDPHMREPSTGRTTAAKLFALDLEVFAELDSGILHD